MTTMNSSGPDNATLQMLRNPALAAVLPAVYSVVAAVSVPGNVVALWVLCRHIGPRSPCVVLMINLSLTDLLLGAVLPVQARYHLSGQHWAWGRAGCSAVTVAFYANMYSSIVTVTCISVERFLGVVHPVTSARWRRRRYAVGACVATWLLLLGALWPLARTDLTYDVTALGIVTCFDVLPWSMLPGVAAWAAFLFTLFVVLFLVPFVVTVACYVAIIARLLRDSHGPRSIRGEHGSHGPGSHAARRRSLCLAAVVLAAFVTCFAPNNLALLAHVVARLYLGRSFYHVYKLTLGLSCLNNCLDPFVYYFASREFQLGLRELLRRGPSRRDSATDTHDSRLSTRTREPDGADHALQRSESKL